MNSRISLLLLVCLLTVGSGIAVADASTGLAAGSAPALPVLGDAGSTDIVEEQTLSLEDAPRGEATIDIEYHVGSAIAELTVMVREDAEVTDADGFSQSDEYTYEWDGRTSNPSLELAREVNETSPVATGYDFVETGDWALVRRAGTSLEWTATARGTELTRHFEIVQEPATVGQSWAYVGDHETITFSTGEETVSLVVPAHLTSDVNATEIASHLSVAAESLDVGGESEELTMFVAPDPIRTGGLASGNNHDVWVHHSAVAEGEPPLTLVHEYVHTRQEYRVESDARWTIEAGAEYYSHLVSLKAGAIEAHDFYDFIGDATERHAEAILTDPETWDSRTDYQLGAVVMAALDAEIRETSNDRYRFEHVFTSLNGQNGPVTDADLQGHVNEAAGTLLDPFFEDHIRSTPGDISLPTPDVFDGPNDRATLRTTLEPTTLERGDEGYLTITITNVGPETSLAPYLQLSLPDGFAAQDTRVNESVGTDSAVTPVEEGWVFDHLSPDETLTIDVRVIPDQGIDFGAYDLDASTADLSNWDEAVSGAVVVSDRPGLSVDAPDSVVAGEPATFEATVENEFGDTTVTWQGDDLADTAELTGEQVELIFDSRGTESLSVTVADEYGLTERVELSVDVEEATESTAEADDPAVAAPGFGPLHALVGIILATLLLRRARC